MVIENQQLHAVNEAKKIANIPNTSIATQTQTQPNTNTTPLVSLDNPSTLTISDLFEAHSSFHLIFLVCAYFRIRF